MLSLREFAKIAGVSRMTVSRAFSGSDKISIKTRAYLVELAEKYDFRPCAVQPSSRKGKTRSVGVLYPGFNISYFMDIGLGVQAELISQGYLPILLSVIPENLHDCLNRLIDHRIDGLIFTYSTFLTELDFERLKRLEIPLVFFGHSKVPGLDACYVDSDDEMGGRLAAQHLLELGHRKIAMVSTPRGQLERETSFMATLSEAGIKFSEKDIVRYEWKNSYKDLVHDPFPNPGIKKNLVTLLNSPNRPTAIFASTDLLALDVYTILNEMNIKIPEDISVIGYADLRDSRKMYPPLTTIRQDGKTEGRKAAELIIKTLNNKTVEQTFHPVPTELIIRDSTSRLN
jgi:DNA-binding LacI/PurR family transcriptional regulator